MPKAHLASKRVTEEAKGYQNSAAEALKKDLSPAVSASNSLEETKRDALYGSGKCVC